MCLISGIHFPQDNLGVILEIKQEEAKDKTIRVLQALERAGFMRIQVLLFLSSAERRMRSGFKECGERGVTERHNFII